MSRKLGQQGEKIAANYLQENGYQILAKNYQAGHLEIDLIALKDNILSFVEVKCYHYTNQNIYYAINYQKQTHLTKAAQIFLVKNPLFENYFCRFDAVLIQYNHRSWKINFVEDIFRAQNPN